MADAVFVRIRQLRKIYPMGRQTVRALDGIDLDIPEGSFTVIMGPSGSGKSTLLYLLGGLDRPSSGSIEVRGRSPWMKMPWQFTGASRWASSSSSSTCCQA
jgi:putative ABC transport system ATP-binding protein